MASDTCSPRSKDLNIGGTVSRVGDLIAMVPDDVELRESGDKVCDDCGKRVAFRSKDPTRGEWYHLEDTSCPGEGDGIWPVSRTYKPLFNILEEQEKKVSGSP